MSYTEPQQKTLLALARASIEYGLAHGLPLPVNVAEYEPALRELAACFVTLQQRGDLRGCIGTLAAYRPLVEDVAAHAFAAAFKDPRFMPLRPEELAGLEIHISVLTAPEPLRFSSEEDLLRQIRPGIDGLILEDGLHRGTFLPSVWESLPEARLFLNHLKRKAGLPENYWSPALKMQRYTAESIG
jgi:AmmeMemoRadiSam system protein A